MEQLNLLWHSSSLCYLLSICFVAWNCFSLHVRLSHSPGTIHIPKSRLSVVMSALLPFTHNVWTCEYKRRINGKLRREVERPWKMGFKMNTHCAIKSTPSVPSPKWCRCCCFPRDIWKIYICGSGDLPRWYHWVRMSQRVNGWRCRGRERLKDFRWMEGMMVMKGKGDLWSRKEGR